MPVGSAKPAGVGAAHLVHQETSDRRHRSHEQPCCQHPRPRPSGHPPSGGPASQRLMIAQTARRGSPLDAFQPPTSPPGARRAAGEGRVDDHDRRLGPRLPPHGEERWSAGERQLAHDLEAVTLVEPPVVGAGRLEVRGLAGLVDADQGGLEQGRAEAEALQRRLDAEEPEVPVRLVRVVGVEEGEASPSAGRPPAPRPSTSSVMIGSAVASGRSSSPGGSQRATPSTSGVVRTSRRVANCSTSTVKKCGTAVRRCDSSG